MFKKLNIQKKTSVRELLKALIQSLIILQIEMFNEIFYMTLHSITMI